VCDIVPPTTIIEGRAWVFGDDVDTDQIISGKYLTILDYAEMARHAFEATRPEIVTQIRAGDVIVAGTNFGGGSSREEAPAVLKHLGVACVLAESFARIFYRNCFNIGLPAMVAKDIAQKVQDGDTVRVDLTRGEVRVLGRDVMLEGEPIPDFMMEILSAGGAVEWFKSRGVHSWTRPQKR